MAHDIVLWSLSFEIARAVSPQYSSPLPNFTSFGADARMQRVALVGIAIEAKLSLIRRTR